MAVELTEDQVIWMEQKFLEKYTVKEFQEQLNKLWWGTNDQLERMKRRQELCLTIQGPVIEELGFEPTKKGVAQSTAAVGKHMVNPSPELQKNHLQLTWLCDPDQQRADPFFMPDVEGIPRPEIVKERIWPEDFMVRGAAWVVVGGIEKNGIVVRKGEAFDSLAYQYRLAPGSRILVETQMKSKRLHYRKVSGDGPDYGWVSIETQGRVLVAPEVEMSDELWRELFELLESKTDTVKAGPGLMLKNN